MRWPAVSWDDLRVCFRDTNHVENHGRARKGTGHSTNKVSSLVSMKTDVRENSYTSSLTAVRGQRSVLQLCNTYICCWQQCEASDWPRYLLPEGGASINGRGTDTLHTGSSGSQGELIRVSNTNNNNNHNNTNSNSCVGYGTPAVSCQASELWIHLFPVSKVSFEWQLIWW